MNEASLLIDLLSNIGFPIVMVFYLLNRFEKRLDIIINLLQDLTKLMT